MSISSELLTLNTTKQNIKTAINLKGVTVNDEPFADYPDKIRLIPSGGGNYESNIILYIEGELRNAEIPSGTTKIGINAFYGFYTTLENVTIPNTVTEIEEYAFEGCRKLNNVTLPSGLTTIWNRAFEECISFTSVVLPASVTDIHHEAFKNCTGLTSITVNAVSPPTIGNQVFDNTNNCPIYVPANSVLAYQTASGWQTYASRITAIP